jgi:hypothetical protein
VKAAPIVLIALDQPVEGNISASVEGEPSFLWVEDIGDALYTAVTRGVDLVIPAHVYAQLRHELPPELPDWIKVV